MKHIKSKKIKILVVLICGLLAVAALTPCVINAFVVFSADRYIISQEEAAMLDADCILVLGARVNSDGTLSHMLEDRMSCGVSLYKSGAGRMILASGDHGQTEYDEVNSMKQYAVDNGVPADDVFLDHAGFSTYESMYRARDVFEVKKVVIVTQRYHLYRAVYNARALGLEAYGVASDLRTYGKPIYNNTREFLARVKDFGMCIIKPEPTYLGEAIPISGSASESDDRSY